MKTEKGILVVIIFLFITKFLYAPAPVEVLRTEKVREARVFIQSALNNHIMGGENAWDSPTELAGVYRNAARQAHSQLTLTSIEIESILLQAFESGGLRDFYFSMISQDASQKLNWIDLIRPRTDIRRVEVEIPVKNGHLLTEFVMNCRVGSIILMGEFSSIYTAEVWRAGFRELVRINNGIGNSPGREVLIEGTLYPLAFQRALIEAIKKVPESKVKVVIDAFNSVLSRSFGTYGERILLSFDTIFQEHADFELTKPRLPIIIPDGFLTEVIENIKIELDRLVMTAQVEDLTPYDLAKNLFYEEEAKLADKYGPQLLPADLGVLVALIFGEMPAPDKPHFLIEELLTPEAREKLNWDFWERASFIATSKKYFLESYCKHFLPKAWVIVFNDYNRHVLADPNCEGPPVFKSLAYQKAFEYLLDKLSLISGTVLKVGLGNFHALIELSIGENRVENFRPLVELVRKNHESGVGVNAVIHADIDMPYLLPDVVRQGIRNEMTAFINTRDRAGKWKSRKANTRVFMEAEKYYSESLQLSQGKRAELLSRIVEGGANYHPARFFLKDAFIAEGGSAYHPHDYDLVGFGIDARIKAAERLRGLGSNSKDIMVNIFRGLAEMHSIAYFWPTSRQADFVQGTQKLKQIIHEIITRDGLYGDTMKAYAKVLQSTDGYDREFRPEGLHELADGLEALKLDIEKHVFKGADPTQRFEMLARGEIKPHQIRAALGRYLTPTEIESLEKKHKSKTATHSI